MLSQRTRLLSAALVGLVTLNGCATQTRNPTAYRANVLGEGVTWVRANTAYRDLSPVKSWVEATPQEMETRMRQVGFDPETTAYYDCRDESIHFRADLDLSNIAIQSVMIHELIHHGQCVRGAFPTDMCQREKEPTQIQVAFVRYFKTVRTTNAEQAGRLEKAAKILESKYPKSCGPLY